MKIWSTTAKKVIDKRKMGRGEMGNGREMKICAWLPVFERIMESYPSLKTAPIISSLKKIWSTIDGKNSKQLV